jgi:hypothetical protein
MTCAKCGSPIADGAAFCASCGTATKDPTAETVAISIAQMEDPLLVAVREGLAKYYVVEKELGRGCAQRRDVHRHRHAMTSGMRTHTPSAGYDSAMVPPLPIAHCPFPALQ